MRAIKKKVQVLTCLQTKTMPIDAAAATAAWGNFREKEDVQNCLLEEQFHLCCYSEVRADLLQLGYHIEHVEPKSRHWQRTFDYTNLAACALHSNMLQSLPSNERFGGHFKLDRYHRRAFISCHQTDCALYFSYLSDGRIVAKDGLKLRETRRANYTIALLNLNSQFLLELRQAWWQEIEQLWFQHHADDSSLADLAAVDLIPGRQGAGKLSPFFSLTRQFFGPLAEQVLQQHAPELA